MESFDGRQPGCRLTDGSSPSTFMGFGKVFKKVTTPGFSYKRLKRIRSKLHLTGKQIKRKLGLTRVNSAAGVSASDSIYGPTGSIVGRY